MNMLIQLPYGGDWVSAELVESIAATDVAVIVHMKDGTWHTVKCSMIGEAKPLRDKLAAQVNEALQIMAAPHLRINSDGYATALTARWHYPAAGELAPPGVMVQLLTIGGKQVQGTWQDEHYIAWAPNLKRDRVLEQQHNISTNEGKY